MSHPLAQYLDFANHHANATPKDIETLCANVLKYGWGNVPQPIGGSDELGPIQIEAVEAYSFDAAVAAIAFRPDTNSTD